MSTLRLTLAFALLLIAALSALAGDPTAPLAGDEIDAVTLAERLQARQTPLLLVDLRDDSDRSSHQSGSIPGAQPLATLEGRVIPPAAILVLVDQGNVERRAGQRIQSQWPDATVLRLRGGFEGWGREVLYPTLRADASARQRAAFDARAKLSRYFGGSPRMIEPGASPLSTRSRQGC